MDEDVCSRCGGDHDRIDSREPCPPAEMVGVAEPTWEPSESFPADQTLELGLTCDGMPMRGLVGPECLEGDDVVTYWGWSIIIEPESPPASEVAMTGVVADEAAAKAAVLRCDLDWLRREPAERRRERRREERRDAAMKVIVDGLADEDDARELLRHLRERFAWYVEYWTRADAEDQWAGEDVGPLTAERWGQMVATLDDSPDQGSSGLVEAVITNAAIDARKEQEAAIKPGDVRVFRSSSDIAGAWGYKERTGWPVTILKVIGPNDSGMDPETFAEVGPMFRIAFADAVETDAFLDELGEVD